MKLGSRITDPASGERGYVVSESASSYRVRLSIGKVVRVPKAETVRKRIAATAEKHKRYKQRLAERREAEQKAERKRQREAALDRNHNAWLGPDAELSRLARLNGLTYQDALSARKGEL